MTSSKILCVEIHSPRTPTVVERMFKAYAHITYSAFFSLVSGSVDERSRTFIVRREFRASVTLEPVFYTITEEGQEYLQKLSTYIPHLIGRNATSGEYRATGLIYRNNCT